MNKVSQDSREKFLQSITNGGKIKESCKAAGFSHMAYYAWRKSDKPEDIEYIKRIDAAIIARNGQIEDAIFTEALNGNAALLIFWACNRMSDRWSNTHYIRGNVEHKHTGTIEVNHREEIEALQAEEDRLTDLLNDRGSPN